MILRSIRYYKERVKEDSIWLTIYSDMMTNLMLFFLLLFGLSRMPEELRSKIAEGLESNFKTEQSDIRVTKILKKFREEESYFQMEHVISEQDLKTFTKIEIQEDKIKLTMQDPVLFAPGEAAVKDRRAAMFLRELAIIIKGLPNQVVISGHTDNTPIRSGRYKNNWELSIDRALNIEKELEKLGISPSQMAVAGYGEYMPLFPNDTSVGRAFNRRIEIDIIR